MSVCPVRDADVERRGGGVGKPLPELMHQFQVEAADPFGREGGLENKGRPAAEIDRRLTKNFVHRQYKEPVATNPLFVPQRLGKRLAQSDTGVFDRMMAVDFQVAA